MLNEAAELFKFQLTRWNREVMIPKDIAVGVSLSVNVYIEQPEVITLSDGTNEEYTLTLLKTDDGNVRIGNLISLYNCYLLSSH